MGAGGTVEVRVATGNDDAGVSVEARGTDETGAGVDALRMMTLPVGVPVGVSVGPRVPEDVAIPVGVTVSVAAGVTVGVKVSVAVPAVTLATTELVTDAVTVAVGVIVATATGGVGVSVLAGADGAVGVGVGLSTAGTVGVVVPGLGAVPAVTENAWPTHMRQSSSVVIDAVAEVAPGAMLLVMLIVSVSQCRPSPASNGFGSVIVARPPVNAASSLNG